MIVPRSCTTGLCGCTYRSESVESRASCLEVVFYVCVSLFLFFVITIWFVIKIKLNSLCPVVDGEILGFQMWCFLGNILYFICNIMLLNRKMSLRCYLWLEFQGGYAGWMYEWFFRWFLRNYNYGGLFSDCRQVGLSLSYLETTDSSIR